MTRRNLRHALVSALGVGALLLAACGGGDAAETSTPAAPTAPTAPPPRTDSLTGAAVPERTTRASDFDADLVNAAAGTFPPLDFPRVVSAAEATWLVDDDLVLGAVQNGEARAYPLFMMTLHHVSNDRLGGEPYLVTF